MKEKLKNLHNEKNKPDEKGENNEWQTPIGEMGRQVEITQNSREKNEAHHPEQMLMVEEIDVLLKWCEKHISHYLDDYELDDKEQAYASHDMEIGEEAKFGWFRSGQTVEKQGKCA